MISQSDFLDWKANPVTKAVFKAIEERCYDLAVDLAGKAGLDSLEDRYTAGMIRGLEQIAQIEFGEAEDNDTTS